MNLSPDQTSVINAPLNAKIFLEGPAGSGKTAAGVERLLAFMAHNVPGSSILVMLPQRVLAAPYKQALLTPGVAAGGQVSVVTMAGLARRTVELFWPLAAESAGFTSPDQPPIFLNLETALYYMSRIVRPLLEKGYFETVTIDRNRLYQQILDNLNKAAVVGFPLAQIAGRLGDAWGGDPAQKRVFTDAQDCADRFRSYCLAHNLLDFSLLVEVFTHYIWPVPACRDYLLGTYRHLIADNIEEDTPVVHDLLLDWLPHFDSALVIYDQEGGYRSFLGADPQGALRLRETCDLQLTFEGSFVTSEPVAELARELSDAIDHQPGQEIPKRSTLPEALAFEHHRFFPQMLDWVAAQIADLVNEEGVSPGEIAVLAPTLSDALRFSLAHRLEAYGIASRAHRPSRSLREEAATRCLLTLACLAHPEWELLPAKVDLTYALIQSIAGLDLVRAQLLVDIVYRPQQGLPVLTSFGKIKPDVQERITYPLGERYERLRLWLEEYRQGMPADLDQFMSRLSGEMLSQPGYAFHDDLNAGEVAANLIESIQNFRWSVGPALQEEGILTGKEYTLVMRDGIIAAQYMRSWQSPGNDAPEGAVLLAPVYAFLVSNRPVEVQFWLDIGSQDWFERLHQPVTHPYVLSRRWQPGKVWDADDEFAAAQASLHRLTAGLLRRCRRRVYLGISELSEQGYEQRSPLLTAIRRVLRHSNPTPVL
jgi:hypothetical protein